MEYKLTTNLCKTYRFKFNVEKIPYKAIMDNSVLLKEFLSNNSYAIKSIVFSEDQLRNHGKVEIEILKDWLSNKKNDEVNLQIHNLLKEYFNLPSLTYKSFKIKYEEKIPSLKIFKINELEIKKAMKP